MPDSDEQRYRNAYDQFFQGNLEPMRELCSEDYEVHIPTFGMDLKGREQAFKSLRQLIEQANIRNRIDKIDSHGEFVVMHVSGSSDIRGEYRGVDVVRVDDEGRAVEAYLLRNPLPPGTDIPTG